MTFAEESFSLLPKNSLTLNFQKSEMIYSSDGDGRRRSSCVLVQSFIASKKNRWYMRREQRARTVSSVILVSLGAH
jgi:hypothetical protein